MGGDRTSSSSSGVKSNHNHANHNSGSGHERAIEALIDMDPRGASFRVSKILVSIIRMNRSFVIGFLFLRIICFCFWNGLE